jgi:hypothetical protein
VIKNGILNPQIRSLLARVRHTNTLVIADRGFPYWPMIETVDISLVDDIPTVLQVFEAVKSNFIVGHGSETWGVRLTLLLQRLARNRIQHPPYVGEIAGFRRFAPYIEVQLKRRSVNHTLKVSI